MQSNLDLLNERRIILHVKETIKAREYSNRHDIVGKGHIESKARGWENVNIDKT